MRAIVVYDTWYGDTRKVAEEIARGIAASLGLDPGVVEVDHAAPAEVRAADLVVLGTPNHFGGPTRKMLAFVRELRDIAPLAGTVAVFDTCFAEEAGKAVGKLAGMLGSLAAPGSPAPSQLSILVEGTRGPLRAGELARAHAFGGDLAKLVRGGGIAVPV